jgi:hypothetical protein
MPLWRDYSIVIVTADAELPEMQMAGLSDEHWQVGR